MVRVRGALSRGDNGETACGFDVNGKSASA
jgi:hypothetical protein